MFDKALIVNALWSSDCDMRKAMRTQLTAAMLNNVHAVVSQTACRRYNLIALGIISE